MFDQNLLRDYIAAKLSFEIDVVDVAEGLERHDFVLIDTRKKKSWDQGHIPGAEHLPTRDIGDAFFEQRFPKGSTLVVYGWGPGCNGGTKAAARVAELGYSVREMIGGFEYWYRQGFPVESAAGTFNCNSDPLVTAETLIRSDA